MLDALKKDLIRCGEVYLNGQPIVKETLPSLAVCLVQSAAAICSAVAGIPVVGAICSAVSAALNALIGAYCLKKFVTAAEASAIVRNLFDALWPEELQISLEKCCHSCFGRKKTTTRAKVSKKIKKRCITKLTALSAFFKFDSAVGVKSLISTAGNVSDHGEEERYMPVDGLVDIELQQLEEDGDHLENFEDLELR